MRFAVAHKASTYLMVGFAYLALVAGGALPSLLTIASAVMLLVSWFWEPPVIRFEKWNWVWTVLSIFALVYSVLTAIATGDFLGIGAQFLVWLTVAKAFNRKLARDWQQMYLLAFLMLVAGSVLNPDLTYGLCFFGFVISSTWAMTLFHLRREMEDNLLVKHAADRTSERVEVRRILDSRRIVGKRFFAGTGALSFAVFLGAAVVFLALPRVGIGFFLKSRAGLTLSGFSDGVKLGGHGVIKSDPTVVMRVQIDPAIGSRLGGSIHWRGVAFDQYSRGQWKRSASAPFTRQTLEQTQLRDRRVLSYANRPLSVPEIDQLATTSLRQDIWLEPLDSDVLFGASMPRILEYAHTLRRRNPVSERSDEMRLQHGSTVRYTVWSELAPPPAETLRAAASGPLPRGFQSYLQLPPEITPRTRELAKTITRGLTNHYDKAVAIERWLSTSLGYTVEQADPGAQEAVDFFLFDRKKGHCEFFASAFAILARAEGIPTRQVNGFVGGEWNEYQGYVAVRAGDAHSWDEVFFPTGDGGGHWVTFDPTPPGGRNVMGTGGAGWRARLARMMDTLRFQWTKWVVEYDLASQLQLLKGVGSAFKSAAAWTKARIADGASWTARHWYVGAPLLAIVVFVVLRRLRRSGTPDGEPLPRRPRRARSSVAEVYDAIAKLLAKSGHARTVATTPRELATRLREANAPAAAEVGELVELYYAAEWGARRDPAAEARAAALAVAIKQALRTHTVAQRR